MAVFHNSLSTVVAPTQHGPLDAIQSVHDAEVEDVAQPWLYYISTNNAEEIFRSHREARAHDHKETVVCVPVLATPEFHRVLQEREHDRTGPRHYLCPKLTRDWLQQNNLYLEHEVRHYLAQTKLTMQRRQELGDAEEDNNNNIGGVVLSTTETLRPDHTEPTRARNEVPCDPIATRGRNWNVRRPRRRSQTYAANTVSSSIDPEVPTTLATTNSAPYVIARTWTSSALSLGRSFCDAMQSLASMLLTLSKCVLGGIKAANPLWLAALLFSLVSWTLLLCNF